ncbi:MAG: DUF4268 domain-containing protein [Candidatus Bathyarchaeota archaeon]|nr:DUF4268 domain-containing protein [Candidatus Bathyarchaeota archaeon]
MIEKLQRVPLRYVWKDEAKDFTPWLVENIDVLTEILDFQLTNPEREKTAGSFSVDLIAEDEMGNTVVIENQLEKSNHDHLGKLITYLVAVEAKAGIWIVADPQPEHVHAITWLNESSSTAFYLIKVEAVKIGSSAPAPLFTLIVGPNEETREVGKIKEERAERYDIRQKFWTGLLASAKKQTQLHDNISPSRFGWVGTSAGTSGLSYNYVIREHNADVELYIDIGEKEENKAFFDALSKHKTEIEAQFGDKLDWQKLDNRRASRVKKQIDLGGWRDEDKWSEMYSTLISTMINFVKAMKPYVQQILAA